MKKKILMMSVICVVIGAVITAVALWKLYAQSYADAETTTHTVSESVSKINISVDAGDIRIIPSENNEMTLTYNETTGAKYSIIEENGVLSVSPQKIERPREKWYDYYISFDFVHEDVILKIPKDFTAETTLKTDYGDIKITGLNGKLTAESDYGDIEISGGKFSEFNLAVDCGDIELERISGDKISLKSDLGDIEGTISGAHKDYAITASTDLGDCNLQNTSGGSKILDAHTSLGDIDIWFTE